MNEYGIFSKEEPRIDNLSQLRSAYMPNSFVSGHIVLGVQCLLPGRHELIFQCRDPVKRLMSGILRKYIKFDHSGMSLNCANQGTLKNTLKKLFADDRFLSFECNGITRRLAGLAMLEPSCKNNIFNLNNMILESRYPLELAERLAEKNLETIDHIFLAEDLDKSLFAYELQAQRGPILNPFVEGHKNKSSTFTSRREGIMNTSQAQRMLAEIEEHLHSITETDRRTYSRIENKQKSIYSTMGFCEQSIRARNILQKDRLLDLNKYLGLGTTKEKSYYIAQMVKARVGRLEDTSLRSMAIKDITNCLFWDDHLRSELRSLFESNSFLN